MLSDTQLREMWDSVEERKRPLDLSGCGLSVWLIGFARAVEAAARADERERACRAVRERCIACNGTGVGGARQVTEDQTEAIECEYCGRPIQAIREAHHRESGVIYGDYVKYYDPATGSLKDKPPGKDHRGRGVCAVAGCENEPVKGNPYCSDCADHRESGDG